MVVQWRKSMGSTSFQLGSRSRVRAAGERLQALLDMALTPGGPRAFFRQRPLSFSAFALVSRLARLEFAPASLIDVGANAGQFTAAALFHWPELQVHAFEPLPDEAATLEANFASLPNVHVHGMALGDEDGLAVLHRHAYSLSSSLLSTTPEARSRFDWAEEAAHVEVAVGRLDSVLASAVLPEPVLLKVDVQGFESQVFAGGAVTLSKVAAIVVEQAFEPFYEGQLPFPQGHAQLAEAGWVLARVLAMRNEDGMPVEADCLYLPGDVPSPSTVPPGR
jgi:FkbM family methyltransferase